MIEPRCQSCGAALARKLPFLLDWMADIVGYALLGTGFIFSVFLMSVWPFLLTVILLFALTLLIPLRPDVSDPITRSRLEKLRKGSENAI